MLYSRIVSDFLTDIEVLGLSSTIVSRGNVYRRMKQIVRFEPEVLIDDDDSAESITWSTGAYML